MNDTSKSHLLPSMAAQILGGMLANPHIYSMFSDEGASGEQERILRHTALEMAEALIYEAEQRDEQDPSD